MSKMTLEQLQNVENFKVSNKYGQIEFVGKVDLTEVDIKDVVIIEEGEAEVYDDERYHPEGKGGRKIKPKVGEKLNTEAIITLYGMGAPQFSEEGDQGIVDDKAAN